jgi:hypothetical protein
LDGSDEKSGENSNRMNRDIPVEALNVKQKIQKRFGKAQILPDVGGQSDKSPAIWSLGALEAGPRIRNLRTPFGTPWHRSRTTSRNRSIDEIKARLIRDLQSCLPNLCLAQPQLHRSLSM